MSIFAIWEIMSNKITYQQKDTLQLEGLLKLQIEQQMPVQLEVDRIPISERNVRSIESMEKAREVVIEKPKPPSYAQIRYWLRRQEESLLVNSSRTMKPITDVTLHTTEPPFSDNLKLPIRLYSYSTIDWLTIILLAALLIFASIKIHYKKYLSHLFQSLINYSTASRMYREREISLLHGSYRLEAYFYIVFSIFFYFTLDHFNTKIHLREVHLYLFSLATTLGYFLLKRILYMSLGIVAEGVSDTMEYLYNQNNYNRVLGLFLFPVVAFIMFSPILSPHFFIVTGLILTGIFYFLTLQRGIMILLKKQFSIYYLFLYLCTLEILPLLLIYKVVIG